MCVVQCWVVAAAVRVGIVLVSDNKYWGSSYLTLHPKPTATATKNHNICSWIFGGIMLKAFIVVATRTNHLNWMPNHIALLKGASGGRRYTSSNCQTACSCIKCTLQKLANPCRIDSIAVSAFADIFIELTNTVSDGKIQITILILRRGALSSAEPWRILQNLSICLRVCSIAW